MLGQGFPTWRTCTPRGTLKLTIEGENLFVYDFFQIFIYISMNIISEVLIFLLLNISIISNDKIFCGKKF